MKDAIYKKAKVNIDKTREEYKKYYDRKHQEGRQRNSGGRQEVDRQAYASSSDVIARAISSPPGASKHSTVSTEAWEAIIPVSESGGFLPEGVIHLSKIIGCHETCT